MLRFAFVLLCLFLVAKAQNIESLTAYDDVNTEFTALDDSLALDIRQFESEDAIPSLDRQECKKLRTKVKAKRSKCGKQKLQIVIEGKVLFSGIELAGSVTIKCRKRQSANKKAKVIVKCLKKKLPKCKCKKAFLKCIMVSFRKCAGNNKFVPPATIEP